MKSLAIAVVLSASLSAFSDEPVDLATYWPETPTTEQTLPEGSYTLGSDYTLPVKLYMKQGSIFDFPDGKTFTVDGDLVFQNPYKDKTTILKGGAWNVTASFNCDNSGTSVDNFRLIMDDTDFTVKRAFFVPAGVPGSALFALTNGATLTVTGSQYCEFCRKKTKSDPFVFDISSGSKLDMGGSDLAFLYSGGGDADCLQNCTLRVRGAGSELVTFKGALWLGQYSPGYMADVSDGGKVNIGSGYLYLGYGGASHDNTLIVRGTGSSFTATYPQIGEQTSDAKHYGATSNNWVRVLDGATATLSTDYQKDCPVGPYSANNGIYVSNATLKASAVFLGCDGTAAPGKTSVAGSNNVLHVTGPSSKVSFSYSWESNKSVPYRPFGAGPYCAMVFEDGAQLKVSPAKGLSLVGTNCLVRVSGAGSKLEVSNNLTIPGENNRIEVSDGAALSCSTLCTDYETAVGAGNTIVVSNASFSAQTVFLGAASAAASNNVLTLTGPSTSLTLSNLVAPYRPFGAGRGCEIRFEDGAQFSSTVGEMDLCGTNCLFRVSGTNEVAQKNSYFDVRNFDISGKGNTVEVSDGGKLRCYISHTYSTAAGRDGTDNTIIVSNGTFSTYQYYGIFIKGESNKLVLQGDSPRVESTCGANFYLYNGAKLVFELPLGKTKYAQPPLSFNYMYVGDGTRGDVEGTGADPEILFPNLEEYQKSIDSTANLQIGKCHTGARMKQIIRDTNAKLPKGCKLTAEEWGDKIILQVKPIRGLLMIVR